MVYRRKTYKKKFTKKRFVKKRFAKKRYPKRKYAQMISVKMEAERTIQHQTDHTHGDTHSARMRIGWGDNGVGHNNKLSLGDCPEWGFW